MEDWKLVVLGLVIALGVVVILANRRPRRAGRSLASKFAAEPVKRPLGMEATDLHNVQGLLDRNDALAQKTGSDGALSSWTAAGAISPPPHHEKKT